MSNSRNICKYREKKPVKFCYYTCNNYFTTISLRTAQEGNDKKVFCKISANFRQIVNLKLDIFSALRRIFLNLQYQTTEIAAKNHGSFREQRFVSFFLKQVAYKTTWSVLFEAEYTVAIKDPKNV